jgi:hypothetical protein
LTIINRLSVTRLHTEKINQQGEFEMKLIAELLAFGAALAFVSPALAGKLDDCPDPAAAKQFVKACMQENPYNTREACEERTLKKLCGGR